MNMVYGAIKKSKIKTPFEFDLQTHTCVCMYIKFRNLTLFRVIFTRRKKIHHRQYEAAWNARMLFEQYMLRAPKGNTHPYVYIYDYLICSSNLVFF